MSSVISPVFGGRGADTTSENLREILRTIEGEAFGNGGDCIVGFDEQNAGAQKLFIDERADDRGPEMRLIDMREVALSKVEVGGDFTHSHSFVDVRIEVGGDILGKAHLERTSIRE